MVYLATLSFLATMYAGFFVHRPASIAVRRADEVTMTTSPWTWAAMLHWPLGVLWLHLSPVATLRSRSELPWILLVEIFFALLVLWMARSFSRRISFRDEWLTLRGPLQRTVSCAVADVTNIQASAPHFILELTLADGTKVILYPFLRNADELGRRVLLSAPDAVLAKVEGPARAATARLNEDERAAGRDGGTKRLP